MPEGAVVASLTEQYKALNAATTENGRKLDRVLEKLGQCTEQTASMATEIIQVRRDITRIDSGNTRLWRVIDNMKKTIFIGIGIAIAISSLLPILFRFILK